MQSKGEGMRRKKIEKHEEEKRERTYFSVP